MRKRFKEFNFRNSTLCIIKQANTIIEEYLDDGYDLTLRQLYYQFVARNIIPNSQKEYKKLGIAINNGRLAGLIDWDAIKDRTRAIQQNSHWDRPESIIESCADCFALDTRQGQDVYLEAWVEKEALAGVVERACIEIDIPWFACRGFVSQTAMYEAAVRCKRKYADKVIILHLGDHDPSGVDMTRDNLDRLVMFGVDVSVQRIALNMDQIEEYDPPSNPVKFTDSRCSPYVDKYGDESWELDALNPQIITTLIQEAAAKYTDEAKRNVLKQRQEEDIDLLNRVSSRWDDVVYMLNDEV